MINALVFGGMESGGMITSCDRSKPLGCEAANCHTAHRGVCGFPVLRDGKPERCGLRICAGHTHNFQCVEMCPAHFKFSQRKLQEVSK